MEVLGCFVNPSVYVGVLIRANCLHTLQPTKFIRNEAGGRYAYKIKLAWCIVGTICQSKSDKKWWHATGSMSKKYIQII